MPSKGLDGMVIWITGLSGSGKSTLAEQVACLLRAQNQPVILLDGDELRCIFGSGVDAVQDHSRDGRLALATKYANLCRIIAFQGFKVVIATISLFREVHHWNRINLPNYFEVYLKVPLEELRRRDPKGIYRRFDSGEISDVAGLDLVVDEPECADWTITFSPENNDVFVLAKELLKRTTKEKLV